MLMTQAETEEIKSRYPDEKPTVFNYMQAREDILRLTANYNALLDRLHSLTPESVLG